MAHIPFCLLSKTLQTGWTHSTC